MIKAKKYKSIALYLFFGACTTLINIISYYIVSRVFCIDVVPAAIAAWTLAVIFAFFTNKVWVFESKSWRAKHFLYEFFAFFASRILTGALDVAIMFVFVEKLQFCDVFVKAASNVLVIVLNYAASRLVIFRGN